MNFKTKSELLVLVFRINVISNFGCRSPCMAFLPLRGHGRVSHADGHSVLKVRRRVCRKHITMKQKFLGSIPSGFQCILGET